jgi:hypothetical protein
MSAYIGMADTAKNLIRNAASYRLILFIYLFSMCYHLNMRILLTGEV